MFIDITKTEGQVGESFEITFSEDLPNFEYSGTEYSFHSPVVFNGIYLVEEHGVGVIGEIKAEVNSVCSRCLKDLVIPLEIDMNEAFRMDSDEEDVYTFSGHLVNIDQAVMDNIALNLPLYVYCQPDCKGLCPHCGVNLNETTCDCEIKETKASGPFSQLAGMFPDEENK